MGEKVWIRDYAEKHGCKVDWDPDLGTVVLDGKYNIWPSEVSEGKRGKQYALEIISMFDPEDRVSKSIDYDLLREDLAEMDASGLEEEVIAELKKMGWKIDF